MRGFDVLLRSCGGRRWGTIIWSGLGYGDAVLKARALDALSYVYLEPNSDLRARIARKFEFSERETLSGNALWSSTGIRPLHVVNDPLRSSLMPPAELLEAWPNLRHMGSYDVQTQSLNDLVAEHEVPSDHRNLLVLNLSGAEYEVLAAADEESLARFTHILLREGGTAGKEGSECLKLLSARGYVCAPVDVAADGWLLLRREQPVHEAEPLHLVRARELEVELEKSVQRAAQLEVGLEQSMQRVTQLEAEKEHAVQQRTHLEGQLQQSVQRVSQLQDELQQSRQTMRMAVQMQAQREVDLADLQSRYRDGQIALERQHALLDKLGDRLGLASDYFHRLSASSDDAPSNLDGSRSQAMSDDGKSGAGNRDSGRLEKPAEPKTRG